jgi:hypothetical protein
MFPEDVLTKKDQRVKQILVMITATGLLACHQHARDIQSMQQRIDSLQTEVADTYKPGFGEFMSNVQAHHAKLWFAGQNENWKLADFELHEILETVTNIQKYETERDESKLIGMIYPALDSVNAAIQQKDLSHFNNSFTLLTNTCNACHHAANFEFNVVKIPDAQMFSNQSFKVSQ